ncbi:MAG: glycosyltransferase family 9 protein [Bacteroidota bacterium]
MKFLVIQTAFLGDVILATSAAEKLHQFFPTAEIDFLLRKGNESVFENHPYMHEVIVLDKKNNKWKNLFSIASTVRKNKYDYVINLHRFGSSGFITWRSGAKQKIGFDKNPLSFWYTKKIKHEIGNGKHETERNHQLIAHLTDTIPAKPKLYPSEKDFERIRIQNSEFRIQNKYICVAPASIWFTKQFPKEKWIELINSINENISVYLIGAENDLDLCEEIKRQTSTAKRPIQNLAGKFSVLQTAALMKDAKMNYVNDSAPMHIASAMNAPVTAIFCSTIPAFGFGPLSDNSKIIETKEKLDCRPCGLHGYKQCPEEHFKCALTIA